MSVNPTTIFKTFCLLFKSKFLIKNYHLFYLLLLVSVFYVSVLTNVFIQRFEWVLIYISVLWYCYWILSPFYSFSRKYCASLKPNMLFLIYSDIFLLRFGFHSCLHNKNLV